MKKLLFTAAIVALGFTTVNAQEVKFGVKAGVNLASLSGDDTDDLDGRTSFHVGGVAEIMISEKFSFQPELMYSSQGAQTSFEDEFEKEEGTVKLDYINVPLMGKFYVAEGFSIEAGPQIGFLMNAEAEVEYTNKEFPEFSASGTQDIKDEVSGIDFGVNFGLGYKLESGLNFGARYNLGLSNVNDYEGSDDDKVNNSVIQVSVGFMF
ncbi:porin family protein [Lacinutrix sp. Hel_I_90]|uniref:porin family protein n=1 Tax=Lacinutrix sp. Hel_I_90 TaxID=1249999 RepID=UPI0005CB185C|nr:porin family protein [Lacinutrix sp. Hel_I_90]